MHGILTRGGSGPNRPERADTARGPKGPLSAYYPLSVANQFDINAGTIVTIAGKNHNSARPNT
jgi:hypothetical protein